MNDRVFVIDDNDRYSRMRLIAWWDQEKLRNAKVLVVGAGALGNEVLKNFALLGVGTIFLIDMDHIEASNLTRSVLFRAEDTGEAKSEIAAKRVTELNPDVTVNPIVGNVLTDIGVGLVKEVDVVIGCLDNREARLWVNRLCWKANTPWVDGGIQEINGVAKVFVPPDGACYECGMTENDYRLIQLRYSCPLLKQEDILAGKTPTAPTIASIIGGLQTQEALKLIHGMEVADGSAFVFNGVVNQMYTTAYPHREDCLSHESYDQPIETELGHQNTVQELFEFAASHFDNDKLQIELDRDIVVSLDCAACGEVLKLMKPRSQVSQDQSVCKQCQNAMQPVLLHKVERNSDWNDKKLSELGVPAYDIVKISDAETEQYFVLTADNAQVMKPTND